MRSLVQARRAVLLRASAVLALALLPTPAFAQSSLGVLDDASVLRRGLIRFDAMLRVARADARYGLNTPGLANGSLEPLAIDFNVGDLGVSQFPGLATTEQRIRTASGLSNFMLSLGTPVISSEISATTVPMRIDVGVTSRLMVGIMVPYVRTRNHVRADFNPNGAGGNTGVNPALAEGIARATNSQFRNEITSAAVALREALDACSANPGAPNCPALEADRAAAEALIAESRTFRDQVEVIYGSDTAVTPALFIPRAGSPAQAAIDARAATISALYRAFLDLPADPITARPFAAQTPLAAGQAQALFTDPDARLGLAVDPLQPIERSHLGDIEIGAKLLVLDSFDRPDRGSLAMRAAVAATFRFATGQEDDPDNLFDVPTGDGQNDIELRTAVDVGVARRVTATLRGRYTVQLADRTTARITDAPSDVFSAAYRRQQVDRDLGDIVELDVIPRYVVSPYFAVVGQYLFRRKAEDRYTGRFTITDAVTGIGDIDLDAATLARETGTTEQRVGLGFTFSLQPAATEGRVRRPVDIAYLHSRTIRGSGNQPQWTRDVLQIRITTPFLGR